MYIWLQVSVHQVIISWRRRIHLVKETDGHWLVPKISCQQPIRKSNLSIQNPFSVEVTPSKSGPWLLLISSEISIGYLLVDNRSDFQQKSYVNFLGGEICWQPCSPWDFHLFQMKAVEVSPQILHRWVLLIPQVPVDGQPKTIDLRRFQMKSVEISQISPQIYENSKHQNWLFNWWLDFSLIRGEGISRFRPISDETSRYFTPN